MSTAPFSFCPVYIDFTVRLALVLAAFSLLLTGCSSRPSTEETLTPAPRTESQLPNGWKEISTSGVALAFPPGWTAIDLAREALEKGGDSMFGNDPKMAPMRAQARALAAQGVFKVFVFKTDTIGTGFATNCNVAITPSGGTLDEIAEQTRQQVVPMAAPGTTPKVEYVQLKAGRCARLLMDMKSPTATALTLASTVYIFKKGSDSIAVTFTCPTKDRASIAKVAEQVMGTFRFTD